jgi:hypothetical protein
MNPTWSLFTPERMGWARWTRKRRNKFKKRWRAQHRGPGRFFFMRSEFVSFVTPEPEEFVDVVFHVRA